MPNDVEIVKGFAVRLLEGFLKAPIVALKKIGALVTSRSQKRFETQSFAKRKWPPPMTPNIPAIIMDLDRGASVKASRFVMGPALKDTNRLVNSINWKLLDVQTVEIGTNVPYAKFHQFGLARVIPITPKVRSNLAVYLRTAEGKKHRGDLGFLFNRDELKFKVLERQFIGVDDQDMADIDSIIRGEVLRLGGRYSIGG